jgi:energy-coupling factor transport system substrate-specific component
MMPAATWVRVGGGLATFLLVGLLGVLVLREIDPQRAADAWSLVTLLAIPAGIAAYALIEYAQTGGLVSITRQFDTRTLVLMPAAVALDIVLGTAVASALKIPVYLDSVGTILVAALAGPLAGALTGFLANLVWTYLAPPPFASPFAAPFALVAVVIGLLAGSFARWGWLRPRPGASGRDLLIGGGGAIGLVGLMAILALGVWQVASRGGELTPSSDEVAFLALGWLALLLVVGTGVGLAWLLLHERDLAAAYIVVAGVVTGITAAIVAAPIAASLFGGVTGSGADFVIAAFRQAGADLQQAVLGQSLVSDSIDKVVTYFVVYLILGALAVRTKARFPQGRYLLPAVPETVTDRTHGAAAAGS